MTNVSKKQGSPKGRKWCFDIFYTKKDSDEIICDIDWESIYKEYSDIIRYLVVQKERGEENKRLHWQGYIQLYNQHRRRSIQRLTTKLKIKHWCELAKGCAGSNRDYCTKLKTSQGSNDRFEFGTPCTQGARTDLEDIKKRLDDGGTMLEIANNHFGDFIRYHSGFRKYKELVDKELRKHNREVDVEVISGPTGAGKSWNTVGKDLDAFVMDFQNGTEWWDGYNGEKTIIIEEYNNDIKITRLLRILDSYRLRLPIKGGFTYANWNKVIITTNLTSDEFHPKAKPEHRAALTRRINRFTNLYEKDTKVSQSVLGNTGAKTLKDENLDDWILELDDDIANLLL
jgi:hypothetical protein